MSKAYATSKEKLLSVSKPSSSKVTKENEVS